MSNSWYMKRVNREPEDMYKVVVGSLLKFSYKTLHSLQLTEDEIVDC